jgi:hypothetical protein
MHLLKSLIFNINGADLLLVALSNNSHRPLNKSSLKDRLEEMDQVDWTPLGYRNRDAYIISRFPSLIHLTTPTPRRHTRRAQPAILAA